MRLTVELKQLQTDHPEVRERRRGFHRGYSHTQKYVHLLAHRIIYRNLIFGFSLEIEAIYVDKIIHYKPILYVQYTTL